MAVAEPLGGGANAGTGGAAGGSAGNAGTGGGSSLRDDNSGYTWGDLAVVGGGATLGIYGGVEPNPISKCVPLSNLPLPKGIPIPSELLDDSLINDWPQNLAGPHVGIGVSERFFNYALSGMYNSGLLCLGITTKDKLFLGRAEGIAPRAARPRPAQAATLHALLVAVAGAGAAGARALAAGRVGAGAPVLPCGRIFSAPRNE